MSGSEKALSSLRRASTLALLAAAVGGIALGWHLQGNAGQAFTYAYALFQPVLLGAWCFLAIRQRQKTAGWVVLLVVVLLLLNLAKAPHVPTLSAIAVAAGVAAVIATFFGKGGPALAATALCCASFSATLFIGLLQ